MSSPAPTRQLPTEGPSAGGDEFDDLFDYDGGINDPFSENYVVPQSKDTTKNTARESGGKGGGLGIDEEVEVTRKPRAPRVKLDEHRLLSAAGIPKLRKKAKDHLKFKGKGHEYSDASRLLAFYQLWLDDLFPKARFLDALAMVEKMGHKKMMQVARMEWVNEGKPQNRVEEEDGLFDEPQLPARERSERIAPIFEKAKEKTPDVGGLFGDDDDLYDATPRAVRTQPAVGGGGTSLFGPARNTTLDDEMDDDLGALLAQEGSMVTEKPAVAARKEVAGDEDFDDDLDALMAEEEAMQIEKPKAKVPVEQRADFDDEMEAMAEMDGLWD